MSSLLIVGGAPRLKKRTRLTKFARLYSASGYTVNFAGWERTPAERREPQDELVNDMTILHRGGGWNNKWLALHYPWWSARVAVFLIRSKIPVVHALGFESALPAVLCSLVRKDMVVVFDDADRFSYSHPLPRIAKRVIEPIERWVARRSFVHVIPGMTQYPDGTPCDRTVLLKNSPGRSEIEAARAADVEPVPPTDLVLYVNGWVGTSRGAALALRLAKEFIDDSSFRIIVAGRLTGPEAEELVLLPNVEFHGEVSNVEALKLYRQSSLCLTMYDPAVEINKHAAPNKWGDCVQFGVPMVVNDECLNAQVFIDNGAAVHARYDDTESLVAQFRELRANPPILAEMTESMSQLSSVFRLFDDVVEADVISAIRAECSH